MVIPQSVYRCHSWYTVIDGRNVLPPLYSWEVGPKIDIGTFWCTSGRDENDCFHAKPVSLKGADFVPTYSDGSFYYPCQLTRENSYGCSFFAVPNFTCVCTLGEVKAVVTAPLTYRVSRWLVEVDCYSYLYLSGKKHYGRHWRCSMEWDVDSHEFIVNPKNAGNAQFGAWFRSHLTEFFMTLREYTRGQTRRRFTAASVQLATKMMDWTEDFRRGAVPGSVNQELGTPTWKSIVYPQPADISKSFIFGEEGIRDWGKPGDLRPNVSLYHLGALKAMAFQDACSSMPRLSDNSIANITEVGELLESLLNREPFEIPKSLNNLWLAYRYQYGTTKMDIREAIQFVTRYIDLGGLDREIESKGIASLTLNDIAITCRCTVALRPRTVHYLAEVWRALSTLGLAPDLYQLWDSTPFSFMVDWFVPIGDVLSAVDNALLYNRYYYDFTKIQYSLSYISTVSSVDVKHYSRWMEKEPPLQCPLFWLEGNSNPSDKTVLYRSLDAASIFLGGIKL